MHHVRLIISGLVQGVGYRAWILRQAQQMPVTGWIRNRDEGTVEVVAEGAKTELDNLIAMCKHGPPAARIDDVNVKWGSISGEWSDFRVVYWK